MTPFTSVTALTVPVATSSENSCCVALKPSLKKIVFPSADHQSALTSPSRSPIFLKTAPLASVARMYTRRFFMLYAAMSSDAENAIMRESGEKETADSDDSSFFVRRSTLPLRVSSRYWSA